MSEKTHSRPLPHGVETEPDAARLRESWRALGVPDVDDAWGDLRHRIGAANSTGVDGPATAGNRTPVTGSRRGFRPTGWARAAAVAALLIGAGGAAWSVPVEVTAAPGERAAVRLPDGSRAELNSGSSLRYARGFSWLPGVDRGIRRVEVEGEIWFDVVQDGRSFRVAAGSASVEVLGTAFSVRSRPGSARPLSVVVEEGRVAVRVPKAGQLELGAGEGAVYSPERGLDGGSGHSLRHALAWRGGGFAAFDAPLGEVLADAARHFGVSIEVADGVGTGERVTVYYGGDVSLERILTDLVTTRGLRFRPTSTGWQVLP